MTTFTRAPDTDPPDLDSTKSTRRLPRQLIHFAAIGVASTLAYLLLYTLLRGVLRAQSANAAALLITAIANTAANRRLTFGVRGRRRAGQHQFQGLVIFGLGLGITSGALAALHAFSSTPPRAVELVVLVLANLFSTLVRFLLFRAWVFRSRRAAA